MGIYYQRLDSHIDIVEVLRSNRSMPTNLRRQNIKGDVQTW